MGDDCATPNHFHRKPVSSTLEKQQNELAQSFSMSNFVRLA